MFDLDAWQEIFSTLQKNPVRTAMTAWGVFWGTFLLVLMLGIGRGLELGVMRNMSALSANNIFLWGGRTSLPYAGLSPGRRVVFDLDDIAEMERSVPGIEAIAPGTELPNWRQGNNVTFGEHVANFGVRGETPNFVRVAVDHPYLGRFINETDMQERRKVVVIGESVHHILLGDDPDPIGKYVQIRGYHFQVVGVMKSIQSGDDAERMDSSLFLPLSTYQAVFNQWRQIGWAGVRAAPGTDIEALEQELRRTVAVRHHANPADPQVVGSFNVGKQFARIQTLFRGVRAFVWVVCIATLCAGALGVSNIMLISVKERTREFGVRKALGASPASVIWMVLQEASVLTALSGYLGLVAGVGALQLLARSASAASGPLKEPSIDLRAALIALLVLVVAGTVAGIAPARHAARIRPVVALRSE
jgi:putative ABC transport system permease protein